METPKFTKTFEALYNISMSMADNCIVNKPLEKRFEKLEEEFHELIEAFANMQKIVPIRVYQNEPSYSAEEMAEHIELIKGELSDLLFVLLHIAHKLGAGYTAFDLLHCASSKMLARMNDCNYIAKN